MYAIDFTPAFERDLKRYQKQNGDVDRVYAVIGVLRHGKPLPQALRDHQLSGRYRECHVEGDRLLVYEKDGKMLRILCMRLVTHKGLREWGRTV